MAKEKSGFNCSYKYAVGVYDRMHGTLKFVDSVDYGTRTATWNKNKPALAMSKQTAIDLQMGLMCNGYTALVIEVPDFTIEELINVEELYKEVKDAD